MITARILPVTGSTILTHKPTGRQVRICQTRPNGEVRVNLNWQDYTPTNRNNLICKSRANAYYVAKHFLGLPLSC